ncbi:MAG: AAA family ATPase [Fimbriimonadales bacterium]|nr:AAA family ATPase [Fimbriimonadales bacterium]
MIRLIEARHYKCLRYVRQPLKPFQILVGANASGKTTFLDVVTLLQDLLRDGVERTVRKRARTLRELVWMQQGDAFELAIEVQLPEPLCQSRAPHTRARYEVRIATVDPGEIRIQAENFWLISETHPLEIRSRTQLGLFPAEQEPPRTIITARTPSGWRSVVRRGEEGRVYVRSETTDWNIGLRPPLDRAGLMVVPEEERFLAAIHVRDLLLQGVQTLMLQSVAMREPCPPDAPELFQPNGSNLPIAVRTLQKNSAMFQRWINHIRTVLNDVQTIRVRERESDRYLYLELHTCTGARVPSWLMSDGTLRFLALTLLAYLPNADGVYLIEEPEDGVHPRAIEAVYQSLSSVYKAQVLCATHSPILLNLACLEQILCFARTESGATDVVSGEAHPRLKAWRGETTLGDLMASGVLG